MGATGNPLSNRDYKNLKSVARAYGSRLLSAVYRESSEEWVRLDSNFYRIELPARKEKRKSIGIDRCIIQDARINWIVNLYESPNAIEATKPLVSGIVRKFLQREGRQDLAIIRLTSGSLDIEKLIEKQEADSSESSFVVLYANIGNPSILRRCMHTYFAIDHFMRLKCSESIAKLLIGDLYPNPTTWRHPPTELITPSTIDFKLTRDQQRALQIAIKQHIAIIEGTVGSGKTHLAACIAYILALQKFQKVLVCSQLPGTIELLSKLLMTNETSCNDSLSVIQISDDINDPLQLTRRKFDILEQRTVISPFTRNKQRNGRNYNTMKQSMVQKLTQSCKLNHLVGWHLYRNFLEKHSTKANIYSDQIDIERLTEKNVAMCCKATRKKAEFRLLDEADIVCCTLDQVGRKLISRHQFDVLIIDDAQMPSDAEILIPLMFPNLKQIILLGQDDVKLGYLNNAIGNKKHDAACDVSKNLGQERYRLFSRLVNSYGPMAKLTQQFRSHDLLIEFCNKHYYRSKMRIHPSATRRYVRNCVGVGDYSWLPKMGNSMSVIFGLQATIHIEQLEDNPIVVDNNSNSQNGIYTIIKKLIDKLVKMEKFPRTAITIVTNLDNLQDLRRNQLQLAGVEIRNVLDFAGMENEFIILCCQQPTVKSHRMSHELEPDFMRNEQALHIALTRAKLGLFVVADQSMLDAITSKAETVIDCQNDSCLANGASGNKYNVVWIDQESADYCAKWRQFVKYHSELGLITQFDDKQEDKKESILMIQ